MSCDGKSYTLLLNTRAVGSAVNWSRMMGFCANAVSDTPENSSNDSKYFISL